MNVFVEEPCFAAAGTVLTKNGRLVTPDTACPFGHEKNITCPCMGGQVPENQEGCRGAFFAIHSADEVIPRHRDQPEPGHEAF